jgi:hypothetical protein
MFNYDLEKIKNAIDGKFHTMPEYIETFEEFLEWLEKLDDSDDK